MQKVSTESECSQILKDILATNLRTQLKTEKGWAQPTELNKLRKTSEEHVKGQNSLLAKRPKVRTCAEEKCAPEKL